MSTRRVSSPPEAPPEGALGIGEPPPVRCPITLGALPREPQLPSYGGIAAGAALGLAVLLMGYACSGGTP